MTQLTEERFEQILTEKLKPLATKEQIDELARITSSGFEDVLERLDVRHQIQRHQKALEEISQKMGLHFEL